MTQLLAWPLPLSAGADGAVLLEALNGTISAILTENAGAAAPPYTFPGMKFADETTCLSKRRNALNDDWLIEHAIRTRIDYGYPPVQFGSVSASINRYAVVPPGPWSAVDLVVVSNTLTSGSGGGTNWAFQVRNLTASQNLFATAKSTNGDELAVDTPKVWTFDQNQAIAQNAVLQIQITKTGSPSSPLTDVICVVRGVPRGV